MSKFIKINSRQSVINARNNVVDFDTPPFGTYSLKDSYVNINCSIPILESVNSGITNNDDTGINPYRIIWNEPGAQQNSLYNIAFVKNCMMKTKKQDLEFIRDVHILQMALNELTLTQEQKYSMDYRRIANVFDRSLVQGGLNCELHGEGSIMSREVEFPVKIPLSQLFSLGRLTAFDADKHGSVRVRLELNLDKLEAQPVVYNSANDGSGTDTPTNLFVGADDITATANNQTVNQLVITDIPKTKEDSPYWVGQKLIVDFDNNGNPGKTAARISEIEFINADNTSSPSVADLGKIRLTFESNLTTLTTTGHVMNNVVINYCQYQDSTIEVESCEMVLARVSGSMPANITYRTFTTEQYNAGGNTNFKRLFEVEPNAMNLLVLQPKPLVSNNETMTDYRISVDNIPTTDRQVKKHTPLYYDKMVSGLGNMGLPLQNLLETNETVDSQNPTKDTLYNQLLVIAEPLPLTDNMKLVQLEFTDASGVNKLNIYKQVVRQL